MTAREKYHEIIYAQAEEGYVEELARMGWHKQPCPHCQGSGKLRVSTAGKSCFDPCWDNPLRDCFACDGDGFTWVGPEKKKKGSP
jgi:hypothetical protein